MGDLALPGRSSTGLALRAPRSSDEVLAKLVAKGSTRAFGLLYRRHHQGLYRYCLAIVRDEQDAQDALQNAMLRALQALQSSERDLAVRPWLFRIAHNEAVSWLRRRGRDARLAQRMQPPADTIENPIESRERVAALLLDLKTLTERQRSALVMRELSGLSNEEISAVLSISPGAAKQAVFEARCALQDLDEGRAMDCEQVRRLISDGDRRVLRGRRIEGHLRACRSCREFDAAIATRGRALHALAPPLPAAAAALVLERVAAHALGGGHAAGVAAASRLAVGKSGVASLGVKGLAAGAAVVAVAAAGGARVALTGASHAHRHSGGPALRAHSNSLTRDAVAPTYPTRSAGTLPPGRSPAKQPRAGAALGATGVPVISPSQPPSLEFRSSGRSTHSRAGGRGALSGARGHGGNGSPQARRHEPARVAHGHQGKHAAASHPSAQAPGAHHRPEGAPSKPPAPAAGGQRQAGRSPGPASPVELPSAPEALTSAP